MSLAFEKVEAERELSAALCEVLETMFFASIEERTAGGVGNRGGDRVGASVAFHGACEGSLAISLDRAAVEALAAGFFGEAADTQVGDQYESVMGELANMVCGAMLSKLDRKAIFCLEAPVALTAGGDPRGWIEKDFALEEGLLHLAFSLSGDDRAGPQ